MCNPDMNAFSLTPLLPLYSLILLSIKISAESKHSVERGFLSEYNPCTPPKRGINVLQSPPWRGAGVGNLHASLKPYCRDKFCLDIYNSIF